MAHPEAEDQRVVRLLRADVEQVDWESTRQRAVCDVALDAYLISGCSVDTAFSHLREVRRGKRGTAKDAKSAKNREKDRQERSIFLLFLGVLGGSI